MFVGQGSWLKRKGASIEQQQQLQQKLSNLK